MKKIELSVDVMFVNNISFVISLGKNMNFTTIENVVDRKAATLLKSLRSIKSVYTSKNIFTKKRFMENEFEVLGDDFREEEFNLNTTAANKHIPQIERQIKAVKEQFHSTWNSLPYQKFPNRIISRMLENTVFWINALPINSGMSYTISPQTLMTWTTINFNKQCKIEFGIYAEAHQKNSPQNSTQSST